MSATYAIAGYATVVLGQPYPVEALSETAIKVIFIEGTLKVVSNIWEHNNGGIFGTSDKEKEDDYSDY